MTIRFFDLCGVSEAHRFSPNCWRTRMALIHKGVAFETVPWRFQETGKIAATGQGRVPVIEHDGRWVHDSWVIAGYLEDAFPDRPSLFGGAAGRALARFVNDWADTVLNPGMARFAAPGVYEWLREEEKPYFRRTREERFGTTLEALAQERAGRLPAFRQAIEPLRLTLSAQPFLGGAAPLYADHIAFGAFQWLRCVSDFEVLEGHDPVAAWRERMLDAYGAAARQAPTRP